MSIIEAQNEEKVSESALLEEIKLALSDYFHVAFEQQDNAIKFSIPNGQKFLLTIKKC